MKVLQVFQAFRNGRCSLCGECKGVEGQQPRKGCCKYKRGGVDTDQMLSKHISSAGGPWCTRAIVQEEHVKCKGRTNRSRVRLHMKKQHGKMKHTTQTRYRTKLTMYKQTERKADTHT